VVELEHGRRAAAAPVFVDERAPLAVALHYRALHLGGDVPRALPAALASPRPCALGQEREFALAQRAQQHVDGALAHRRQVTVGQLVP
jgi:thiamine monophosphate synthase